MTSTVERVTQRIIQVDHSAKPAFLAQLLKQEAVDRALIFTRTKHGADKVVKGLARAGIAADAIHGNKSQNHRERVLAAFRSGEIRTLVADFPDAEQAGNAVSDIVSAGIIPAAVEMLDSLAIEACEKATAAGYSLDTPAALVVELDGVGVEVEAEFERVQRICRDNQASHIRIAQDAAERALIWKGRKAAFAAMGRIAPNYYVQDSVIPRTRLAEVLGTIDDLAREHDLQVANVIHAGDGNLHPLVCYDGARPGEAERAEELAGLIVQACVDAGGSITGEHGVGVDKKRYMPAMFAEADLEAFQKLRCAFDPDGLASIRSVISVGPLRSTSA